jgi:uncharacterized protein (TIGR03067 family)
MGTAAVIVAVSLAAGEAALAPEYQKAEGAWAVTAMAMNGEEIAEEGYKDLRMVLKGRTVSAYSGKDLLAQGTYRIVGTKAKQVRFDLLMGVGADKGKTFPALNEWVDADTIRTCLAQPGKPRPASVETEKGDRRAMFVIKRAK